ncbi:MAG: Holliday junction resolvase RuvX [Anaerolineae bacterium]
MTRIGALDVGERRIGFALADPTGTIVGRTGFWEQGGDPEEALRTIVAWVREEGVGTLVVGHPLLLSGRAGEQARLVEEFAEALKAKLQEAGLGCQVVLWDERLSSVIAEGYLREGAKRGRRRAKGRVDAVAAGVILQSYLERGETG